MTSKPKSDTKVGARHSGPNHTHDYDDGYAAGEAKASELRKDDAKYNDQQPRAGGRERKGE